MLAIQLIVLVFTFLLVSHVELSCFFSLFYIHIHSSVTQIQIISIKTLKNKMRYSLDDLRLWLQFGSLSRFQIFWIWCARLCHRFIMATLFDSMVLCNGTQWWWSWWVIIQTQNRLHEFLLQSNHFAVCWMKIKLETINDGIEFYNSLSLVILWRE